MRVTVAFLLGGLFVAVAAFAGFHLLAWRAEQR